MSDIAKVEAFLLEKGWEHVMTEEDGCDTWSYPSEKRKEWPPWAKYLHGTQCYWDRNDALALQVKIGDYETASMVDQYKGYKWIKVGRHKDDESKTWKQRHADLNEHHVKETTFLIEEIRKLAAIIDAGRKPKTMEQLLDVMRQKWQLTDGEIAELDK